MEASEDTTHARMHDGLEALAARVNIEFVDRGRTDRDRLGGDCFIRIELERYLRATTQWLLPLSGLDERQRKKHFSKPVAELGAGTLARHISGPLCTERTRLLREVSLLFPALARDAAVGAVIQTLTDVMHGRDAKLTPESIARLRDVCIALLQQFASRPWTLAQGQPVGDATVVAAVRRSLGVEQYRVRRADGSTTTLFLAAPGATSAATQPAGAMANHTLSIEASGVIAGRRWLRSRDELLCNFADVIAEQRPGAKSSRWALATLERLVTPMLDAPARAPLSSEAIVFERANTALDRPLLLPPELLAPAAHTISTDSVSQADPFGATALLSIAATGAVLPPSRWEPDTTDPAITRWAHQVNEARAPLYKDPRSAYAALHTLSWSTPSVALRSGLLGDPEVRRSDSDRGRRALIAVAAVSATLATVTAIAYAATRFGSTRNADNHGRSDEVRPRIEAPSRIEVETPEQVLDRWDQSVQSPTATSFAKTYPETAYVHGFHSLRDTEARARSAWAERVRQGGWFRHGARSRTEELASRLSGNARLGCFDPNDPNATVLRFSAPSEWFSPITHPAVPCPTIRGPYFWRMKRTLAGWRICHESWEQQSAICASCPQAPACGG